MERVVGLTLVALAVMLVRSLWQGDGARVSRGVLLFRLLSAVRRRLRRSERVEVQHEHAHGHDAGHAHGHNDVADRVAPEGRRVLATAHQHAHVHAIDVTSYSAAGAVTVGLLHGIGAETGTQALVLVSASRVASTVAGVAVLGAFVAGIIATTATIAIGTAFGWRFLSQRGRAYTYLTVGTAFTSGTVGALFLTGHAGALPGLA
jgi:hypothetical protein